MTFNRRQDLEAYDGLENVITGYLETLSKKLVRDDCPAIFDGISRDHQVRRPTADVDAGDAKCRICVV